MKAFEKGDEFTVYSGGLRARKTKYDTAGVSIPEGAKVKLMERLPNKNGETECEAQFWKDGEIRPEKIIVSLKGINELLDENLIEHSKRQDTYDFNGMQYL